MRPRRTPVSPGRARLAALAVLLAGLLLPGIAGQVFAAPRDSRPATAPLTPTPPPSSRPAAAAPIPAQTATGMCQCVADHDRRHIRCLSSVAECQAACASDKYSFVPNAPNCAVTAQGR